MDLNHQSIQSFIARKSIYIIDLATKGLRTAGISVGRDAGAPYHRLTVRTENRCAILDLTNTIREIAVRQDGAYDEHLIDTGYEMLKIASILNTKLRVVITCLRAESVQEEMDRFSKISGDIGNLSILIFRESRSTNG